MQADRRKLEQEQLDEMYAIVSLHPTELDTIEPAQLGFVCSTRDWRNYIKRQSPHEHRPKGLRKLPATHQQPQSPPLGSLKASQKQPREEQNRSPAAGEQFPHGRRSARIIEN